MFGRCTLMMTVSPRETPSSAGSHARYACPNEAAANGSSSISTNLLRQSPNSRSKMANMSGEGTAGTSSWRSSSSSVISAGSTSTRELRNWPNLIITPPMSRASWRKLRAKWRKRRGRVARIWPPSMGMRVISKSTTMTCEMLRPKKMRMRRKRPFVPCICCDSNPMLRSIAPHLGSVYYFGENGRFPSPIIAFYTISAW